MLKLFITLTFENSNYLMLAPSRLSRIPCRSSLLLNCQCGNISLERWFIVTLYIMTYYSYFCTTHLEQLKLKYFAILPFLVHTPYKIYLRILEKKTIQCTISKSVRVAYHYLYVTSSVCESLGNESVIALLHLQNSYFPDSAVQLQLSGKILLSSL